MVETEQKMPGQQVVTVAPDLVTAAGALRYRTDVRPTR
jgi:hypothetical protein